MNVVTSSTSRSGEPISIEISCTEWEYSALRGLLDGIEPDGHDELHVLRLLVLGTPAVVRPGGSYGATPRRR